MSNFGWNFNLTGPKFDEWGKSQFLASNSSCRDGSLQDCCNRGEGVFSSEGPTGGMEGKGRVTDDKCCREELSLQESLEHWRRGNSGRLLDSDVSLKSGR